MSIRIVTGGQTGVDEGALQAAYELAVPYKAILPVGWKREDDMPSWMRREMEKHPDRYSQVGAGYSQRTKHVVRGWADAVLIVAPTLSTPGTRLTATLALEKPGCQLFHHVPAQDDIEGLKGWLHNIQSWRDELYSGDTWLMVAGPRESKWPGAARYTHNLIKYLEDVL